MRVDADGQVVACCGTPDTEGQIDGGVVMGIGQALWERCLCKDGVIANPHYRDYRLPGAKGVAETSLIPIPAAIAAAVYDAYGVWPDHLRMDAEYIHRLIAEARREPLPPIADAAE